MEKLIIFFFLFTYPAAHIIPMVKYFFPIPSVVAIADPIDRINQGNLALTGY